MKKNRAFLKWAGGKYLLVEEIKQKLPEGNRLIEPFVGAGSVFLNTDYDNYVLSDINSDLINLYCIVKEQVDSYIADAQVFFQPHYNQEKIYYQFRAEFNQSADSYRRSVLFLYLNRHCYNGLCRYNLKGEFNVPFGRYKKPYFPEAELLYFSEKAQKATFLCQSYETVFQEAKKGSVIYCDPPYAPLTMTANFTAYHTNGFNLADQQRLAELASYTAAKKNIPVLISNHATALTQQWYKEAEIHFIKVRRTISVNPQKREQVTELLALYR